ncbi:hypothetical protein [Geodermatophilus sp. SYSU D00700]
MTSVAKGHHGQRNYLDDLSYVWDVEEELDPYYDVDHTRDREGQQPWIRQMRRFRAVAVWVRIGDRAAQDIGGAGLLVVTTQDGEEHRIAFSGGVSVTGDTVRLHAGARDETERHWTLRPTAAPVRPRLRLEP